jgi:hypothetical protein
MKRFDKKGMLVIPNPLSGRVAAKGNVLMIHELFCPNGHSLVTDRAVFNGYAGVLLGVRHGEDEGFVALSPIFGDKARISLGVDMDAGQLLELFCPDCEVKLPVHSHCPCGGELYALFLTPAAEFSDCVGICNRVGCVNAELVSSGELISLSREL